MKALVIVPTLASYPFLRDMCLKMVKQGWEVNVASSGKLLDHHQTDQSSINFHHIELPRGMNPRSHLQAATSLNNLVSAIEPDVVDVHFSAAAFTAAVAKTADWPTTVATVQGLRFPLTSGFKGKLIRMAECWSAKKMDRFIVLTSDDLAQLEQYGVEAIQQQALGFGCDLQKFDRQNIPSDRLDSVKKSIGKSDDTIVLSFIGRLVAFKGFHLVVRAFLQAYESNKNLKLVLCGEYDRIHASGLTDAELEQIEKHKGIVFAGWTNHIEDYLAATDFVVFPSEREGVPVNLMEALCMGVPVITCNRRGCREVMNGGDNGILLEERNVEVLTEAIEKISGDHEFRTSKSDNAFGYRSNFDRDLFVTEHIALLSEVAR